MNSNTMSLVKDSTRNIISNQSENINFYFEEIISSAKEIASSERIRNYTSESNAEDFLVSDENQNFIRITDGFNAVANNDSSLQKIMVINNSGMIIASTDPGDNGKRMSNYKGLFTLAQSNNGISSFFMSGDENNIPVFI